MIRYLYSTKTVLEWALGFYFYRKTHFCFVAPVFYPYRRSNPKSSNPLLIYQDIYQAWRDCDGFDKHFGGLRISLRKGVLAKERERVIESQLARRLCNLCDKASPKVFFPVVFRIDRSKIEETRLSAGGSAIAGSEEFLIHDLKENEVELLFLEGGVDDSRFESITYPYTGVTFIDSYQALDLLEDIGIEQVT